MTSACPTEIELARAISDGPSRAIASHLASCAICARVVRDTERVIDLARDVPVAIPNKDQREEMRTAILAAGSIATTPRRTSPSRARWYVAGAIFAAAAGIALVLATRESPSHVHGTIVAHANARYSTSYAPDEIVTLHDGTIDVEVAPLHANERFRVVTADTEIEVRGTAFRVAAELGHMTSVEVRHGLVEVRPHDGGIVVLAAGESWTARVRTASVVPGSAVSIVEPTPSETVGEPTKTPDGPAPPIDEPSAKPRIVERRSKSPPAIDERSNTTIPRSAPMAIVASSTPPATAARAPESLAYDEAWAAMRGGEFERAASAFARVSILDPEGALSEDASYWYSVALARAKRAEAVAAFRDFLSHYPRSAHAGEANAMLGWLLVEAKQTAEAERRFRAAIDDPKASVRESARQGLAAVRR